jgi:hypothetical protein
MHAKCQLGNFVGEKHANLGNLRVDENREEKKRKDKQGVMYNRFCSSGLDLITGFCNDSYG